MEELRKSLADKLETSRKLGDAEAMASSLYELGRLAVDHGRLDEASRYLHESLQITERLGNDSRLASLLLELGIVSREQNQSNEALDFFRHSLEIAEKSGDEISLAVTLRRLGSLAREDERLEEARKYYIRSLEINKKLDRKPFVARLSQDLGELALDQEQFDDARAFFNESLKVYEELGDEQGVATVTRQLRNLVQDEKAEEGKAQVKNDEPADEHKEQEVKAPEASSSLVEVLKQAATLARELRHIRLGCPVVLISLFDDLEDRVTHGFLGSFGITRNHLLDQATRQAPAQGQNSIYTDAAARAVQTAKNIAQARKATEILPRDLFEAILSDKENGVWLDQLITADGVSWIINMLINWDDQTPITQKAVQAKLVEDRLFANPPTQRDSAADKDLLGFEEYAEALVQIIRKPETRAPLVVGVYGPWGSGKSTFMGLVKRKLDALGEPAATERGRVGAFFERQLRRLGGLFRKGTHSLRVTTVNYDAWAYADAQKLWAGLVDKIAKELDAELTARDRFAYLVNSQSRRLLVAFALGLIPLAIFGLGYSGRELPKWLFLSPEGNKPWFNLPGWITAGGWALYTYVLQKRPLTDAVTSLAGKFDSAPTAGLVSRIQEEFKTALQKRVDPEKNPKSVDTMRSNIRQRVERNELKIVVFIDELDRCPLEKIVEILEAIKLFLAEDIFIVLLGVDTRVAAEAIRLQYKEVQNPNLPREYLEKIVQLPLRVPTAGRTSIETYLKSFMTLPEDGA